MRRLEYKNYMLSLLTIIATFNYLDRVVLALLLEPIKYEFDLSDTQLGFLTGFAFTLFYAVAGIPIARWSDRGNRNLIVTLTTALWSAMVCLCGLVGNFAQLLLIRIGVAVGEAGCVPVGQSLISDYFSRHSRPHAMAIYWSCTPISVFLGYLVGGWLADQFGWRATLIVIGLPGVFLAILARTTLREPRIHSEKPVATLAVEPPLKLVIRTLWRRDSFRYISMAFCIAYFFAMGITQWLPAFFMRSYDMGINEVGMWLALSIGVFGLLGNYLGGVLTVRYACANESLQMRAVAISLVIYGIIFVFIYSTSNKYLAIFLMAINTFIIFLTNAPVFSAIQSLVDDRMRSVAIALIFFMANLVGYGLGPMVVGGVSDLLAMHYGNNSLRYSLLIFSPGFILVAYFYLKCARTIEADIQAMESSNQA